MPWIDLPRDLLPRSIRGSALAAGRPIILVVTVETERASRGLHAASNETGGCARPWPKPAAATWLRSCRWAWPALARGGQGRRSSRRVGRPLERRRGNSSAALTKVLRVAHAVGDPGLGAYLVIRQEMTAGAMIAASIMMGRRSRRSKTAIANWRGFVAAPRQRHGGCRPSSPACRAPRRHRLAQAEPHVSRSST